MPPKQVIKLVRTDTTLDLSEMPREGALIRARVVFTKSAVQISRIGVSISRCGDV